MHLKQNANNSLKLESHTDAMTKIIGYECYDDVLYAVDKKRQSHTGDIFKVSVEITLAPNLSLLFLELDLL